MKALLAPSLAGILLGPIIFAMPQSRAVDHGQIGQAWPIAEQDLMEVIRLKLETARKTGRLDSLNQQFAQKVKARVLRPQPVEGVGPALEDRMWDFDPTTTIEQDIRDAKGNLIAVVGQRINPLKQISLDQRLLFIDGDSEEEVAWALAQGDDRKVKIILLNGSPFERMKKHRRRFYFDQSGVLSARFGIEHTPALVEQDGQLLRIREKAISRRAG